MSITTRFTFTNDLSGTLTKDLEGVTKRDSTNSVEDVPQGANTVSFANCRTKKFLSAVEAKGLKLCGDLQMDGADIFLKDGTSMMSMIKGADFAFGTMSGAGTESDPHVFTHADPSLMSISEPIKFGTGPGFDLQEGQDQFGNAQWVLVDSDGNSITLSDQKLALEEQIEEDSEAKANKEAEKASLESQKAGIEDNISGLVQAVSDAQVALDACNATGDSSSPADCSVEEQDLLDAQTALDAEQDLLAALVQQIADLQVEIDALTAAISDAQAALVAVISQLASATPILNPALGSNKWYLRLVRADDSIEYKEMAFVDELFSAVGASGQVVSLLGAMEQVEDLQEILEIVLNAQKLVTEKALDAVAESAETSFINLHTFITAMETALKNHIESGDQAVVAHVDGRIDTLQSSLVTLHNDTSFSGSIAFPSGTENGCGDTQIASFEGSLPAARFNTDISKWMIDVFVLIDGIQRKDMELEYDVRIEDGKLKVQTSPMTCEAVDGTDKKIVCNAVYCGDITLADIPSGSAGADPIQPAYVAPNTLVDRSDSTGGDWTTDQSTDEGHQPGYTLGLSS